MYNSPRQDSPMAALAAALATLGSTTEARKATVDIIGFPDFENGTGWYTNGPGKIIFIIILSIKQYGEKKMIKMWL